MEKRCPVHARYIHGGAFVERGIHSGEFLLKPINLAEFPSVRGEHVMYSNIAN
jgi:hypothetical protein